jgi:release factor glutamine methyltransferase
MCVRDALRQGLQALRQSGVPSPELAAELLLMYVLGCDRARLHSHPEELLTNQAAERYFNLIAERTTGKPTQYITGHQEFWGLDFEVTPDVLIPRPETERLVEAVLEIVRQRVPESIARCRIVDVGTGSGCIALALASELPEGEIFATEISPAALRVAGRNAIRLGLANRVRFREDDLLTSLLQEGCAGIFDFVVSNPPYVGKDEMDWVQREVREFEPQIAWGGLGDGNEAYRRFFPQGQDALKPGGWVAVEIGYRKSESVMSLLGVGWIHAKLLPDLAGIPRVIIAQKE